MRLETFARSREQSQDEAKTGEQADTYMDVGGKATQDAKAILIGL
ncbi:hypothetical protein [Marinomonas sp.]